MGFSGSRHNDLTEFMQTVLNQLHLEIRKPYVKKAVVAYPIHSMSNIILSLAKVSWNEHMMVERVSPIMENFCYQLKTTFVCPEPNCGGEDIYFEAENIMVLEEPVGLDSPKAPATTIKALMKVHLGDNFYLIKI